MCAVEMKRGCGYRKAGGLYLVSGGVGLPCDRMPLPILPCPHCGEVVKQTRSFQWMRAASVLAPENEPRCTKKHPTCSICPVCDPSLAVFAQAENEELKGKAGLIWCGVEHYKSGDDWLKEAFELGVSRRIAAIPKGLTVGKTWVFVAHPKAIMDLDGKGYAEDRERLPGIIHAFIPQRIELVVTPSMEKQKWVKDLVKQGVTLVQVPEDDPDHAPVVVKKSARKRAMEKHARKFPGSEDDRKADQLAAQGQEADEES